VGKGEREVGVSHQHRACSAAPYCHRSDGQAGQSPGDLHLYRVGSFAAAFYQEFGIAGVSRADIVFIVSSAQVAVRTRLRDILNAGILSLRGHGHAQRIVT